MIFPLDMVCVPSARRPGRGALPLCNRRANPVGSRGIGPETGLGPAIWAAEAPIWGSLRSILSECPQIPSWTLRSGPWLAAFVPSPW